MYMHITDQNQKQKYQQETRPKTQPAMAQDQGADELAMRRYLGDQRVQCLENNQLIRPAMGQTPPPSYTTMAPPPTTPAPAPTYPAPAPEAAPAPTPVITSETVQASPGARTRTTVGVGEEVNLTHTDSKAGWATTAGTISATKGQNILFTAPDTAQKVTITGSGATIAFDVIAPDNVHMDRLTGSGVRHMQDRPDSGIVVQPFVLPDTVNFYNVQIQEVDVKAVADGVFQPYNGFGHDPHPVTATLSNTVVSGKGTQSNSGDCVDSGDPGTPPPFTPGSITFDIPYEYKVGGGSFYKFTTVRQQSVLDKDGTTLTSSKVGAVGSTTVPSPTFAIPECP
jgi:hypothetical protein